MRSGRLFRLGATALAAAAISWAAESLDRQARAAEPVAKGDGPVFWIPIDDGPQVARGMIDPWLSFFVKRHIDDAKKAGASVIVIEIKSYGGLVDSAMEISSTIRAAKPILTVAYVVDRAFSGGALVALSCEKVYMEPGSKIGAALTIIISKEGKPQPIGEKADSPMRATFRALAQQHGRNYALAEAMADPDIVVIRVKVDSEGTSEETYVLQKELSEFTRKAEEKGKKVEILETVIDRDELLTLTAEDAFERFGFIDGVIADRAALLALLGKTEADVRKAETSWPQEVARFIGGFFISGLLLSVAVLALMMALYTPGKGVAGFVFLFAIGLFFWSRFLAGQAGPIEVVLFLLGIALLGVEVFLIPGFGIPGIAGVILVFASLVLSFVPGDVIPSMGAGTFPWDHLRNGLATVLLAMTVFAAGLVVMLRFLPRAPLFNRMVLVQTTAAVMAAGDGPGLGRLTGRSGVAWTDLRPAGKVEVEGELVDAVTDAEFLSKGNPVTVVEVSGNRIVVSAARAAGAEPDSTDGKIKRGKA